MPLKIYRRGKTWHCRGTIAGRTIRESLGTREKASAEYACAQLQAKLEREAIYGKEAEATFYDACGRYFEDHPIPKGKRDQMSAFLVPIIRELRKVRLRDITPGLVKATARKLYPHWKPQSLNTAVLCPIQAVVNNAHQHGWCPPIRIKKFKVRDARLQRPIDEDWLCAFMGAASPHVAALALFMFETAARPKEACLLRPDQLDLKNGIGWSDETKNGKRRIYHLSDELIALMRNLLPREIHGELRVFGYADRDSLTDPWRKTCEKAGIEYRTRYESGRHSHFTHTIVRHGADVVTAAKLAACRTGFTERGAMAAPCGGVARSG
jgi:integrase